MRRKRFEQIVSWITIVMLGGLVFACGQPVSDETRLRQAVADMEKAAEARQLRSILNYLADDFRGNKVYRKANIGGMLLLQFQRNQQVHVFLHITSLKIRAERAQLHCDVLLSGHDQGVVPERARVLTITSDWRKRDGEWRVIRATWRDPLLQP